MVVLFPKNPLHVQKQILIFKWKSHYESHVLKNGLDGDIGLTFSVRLGEFCVYYIVVCLSDALRSLSTKKAKCTIMCIRKC